MFIKIKKRKDCSAHFDFCLEKISHPHWFSNATAFARPAGKWSSILCQIANFDETIHPFEIPKNAGEKLGKEMTPSLTFGLPWTVVDYFTVHSRRESILTVLGKAPGCMASNLLVWCWHRNNWDSLECCHLRDDTGPSPFELLWRNKQRFDEYLTLSSSWGQTTLEIAASTT